MRARSPEVEPKATSTLPFIPKKDLVKLQLADAAISRVLWYWKRKYPPTRRQPMRGPKPARKILRKWKRVEDVGGVLYRVCCGIGSRSKGETANTPNCTEEQVSELCA